MPGVTDMWKVALQDGYCITLFRDEVIMFHKEFQNLLDGMKGYVISFFLYVCFHSVLAFILKSVSMRKPGRR